MQRPLVHPIEGPLRVAAWRTLAPVDPKTEPGDLITAISPQAGRCFRMVYSTQLQSTHCYEPPAWKGVWKDRAGRSWYVKRAGSMRRI